MKKIKTRLSSDGFDYPYTSTDLVKDKSGKSVTTKFEENTQQVQQIDEKVTNHITNHPSGDVIIPPNVANPNLVCWYEVDNKDNNSKDKKIWKDKSGNGNDLELHGFDFNNNGWIDNHLVFDGVKTYACNSNLLPLLSETNDLIIEIVGTCIESMNSYNLVFSIFKDYDNYEGVRIKGGTDIDFNTKTVKKSLKTNVSIGNEFNIKISKVGNTVELYVGGNKISSQTIEGIFQHNIPFALGCGLTKDFKPTLFSKCKIKSLKIEVPSWNTPSLTLPDELSQLSVRNMNILYFEKSSKIESLFIDGMQYKPQNKVKYVPKSISKDKNIFVEVKYKNDDTFLSHSIKSLPTDFYNLKITGKSPYDGEYYLTRFGTRNDAKDYVFSISNEGDITFYKEVKGGSMCFRKYEVKGKTRYTYLEMNGYKKPDFGAGFGFCDLVVLDENFIEIDRANLKANEIVVDGYPYEQHDYIFIDDGHYIGLAYVGVDVSDIPNLSGSYKVVSAVIQEIKDNNVLMQFDSTKYPSLYLDSTENNQYESCPSSGTSYKDYAHINSVKIDPYDNNLVASFRNFDCVMKISRSNGSIIWTLGGKSDNFGLTTEQKFSKQHDSTICSDGSILIFNNNNGKGVSSAKRFWLDEANKTLIKCENYANLDNKSIGAMGGAIEITPFKNVYGISWGMQGSIETLQEIDFDTNRKLLGIEFLDGGYIYKAFRTFDKLNKIVKDAEIDILRDRLDLIDNFNSNNKNVLPPTPPPIDKPVESVSLNKSTHTIKVDETIQLNATVLPSNASNKTINWTSSDTSKATVANGLVTAKTEGSCVITVTTVDGNKTATCNLTIDAKDVKPPPEGNIVTDGLIAWIDFTNISGAPSIIEDKSGNGNNLTLHNVTEGFRNDGLLFDGIDDYGIFDNEFNFKDATIDVEFKKLEAETKWGKIVMSNSNILAQTTPNCIECNIFFMGAQMHEVAVPDKRYIVTLLPSKNVTSFVNKIKLISSNTTDDAKYVNVGKILVGKAFNNTDYFSGVISSIRIYNRCLTDDEVIQNHNFILA